MTLEYSEDNLIEQTAIDLFHNQLGWNTAVAFNKETFGEGSTLGHLNKTPACARHGIFYCPNC